MKFVIKLSEAHRRTGLSPYAVAKRTGIAKGTIARYAENEQVIVDYFSSSILKLIEFYGLDWRDPAVIDVINNGNGA